MKRKNLLTNIAGLILQVTTLIWIFVIYDDSSFTILDFFAGFNVGIAILAILLIAYVAITSMFLVVGIKNKESSIARMILYIVIFVFYILQLVFLYLKYSEYEDIYLYLMVASHVIIYVLLITLFILNIKLPKPEKKIKYDLIVFGALMGLLVLAFILQPIYINSIKNKFKRLSIETRTIKK